MLIDCRKTKAQVISSLANHNRRRQYNELIRTRAIIWQFSLVFLLIGKLKKEKVLEMIISDWLRKWRNFAIFQF